MNIEIKLLNPGTDPNLWVADIYVNNERVSLGILATSKEESIQRAGEWVRNHAEKLAAGER